MLLGPPPAVLRVTGGLDQIAGALNHLARTQLVAAAICGICMLGAAVLNGRELKSGMVEAAREVNVNLRCSFGHYTYKEER